MLPELVQTPNAGNFLAEQDTDLVDGRKVAIDVGDTGDEMSDLVRERALLHT